jgi:hypothetical protein
MASEAGCQVDTHIVDTRIDTKYQWNEWELRRQALMLVNLKQKQTHSAQTVISHFRRESETQHYEPKYVKCELKDFPANEYLYPFLLPKDHKRRKPTRSHHQMFPKRSITLQT